LRRLRFMYITCQFLFALKQIKIIVRQHYILSVFAT
jgi:hypothetical protein